MNPFAVLGLPERAALDPELLQARYLELSKTAHPDASRGDADRFAEINEARRILASPGARLTALLELRGVAVIGKGPVPSGIADLFGQMANAVSRAEAVAAKNRQAATALARAVLAGEVLRAKEACEAVLSRLDVLLCKLTDGLEELDQALAGNEDRAFPEMNRVRLNFLYLEKWRDQLQGCVAGLFH